MKRLKSVGRSFSSGSHAGLKGPAYVLAAIVLCASALLAQQRDTTVNPVGTGEISGVVVSADAQPQPVRRAVVSLSGDVPAGRSVVTDDNGKFAFTRLPVGTFTITARKAAYLATEYGAPKPGRAGLRLALGAGERRAITVKIFKGAAVGGTLRYPSGQPVTGVTVMAIDARAAAQGQSLAGVTANTPQIAETDDRGVYRIYGISPGEYVIGTSVTPGGSGNIGLRTEQEMDALLAALTQRQNRTTGTPPPLPPAAPVSYVPIYFPGTPIFSEAGRIRVAAGDDRDNVNFTVDKVAASTIDGIVSGNVVNPASVQLAIIPEAPRVSSGTFGITSEPPNEQGEFKYGNLAPGRYRIVARARANAKEAATTLPAGATSSSAGLGGGVPPPGVRLDTGDEMLYAVADVDVRGQDVKGVSLALRPGGSISGKVVFDRDKAQLPDDLTALRVGAFMVGGSYVSQSGGTRVGNALSSIPPVNLNDDGTFRIVGLGPAPYYISCQLPAAMTNTWKLRSAMAADRDLLDTGIDGAAIQLTNVTLTLTDKRTDLTGTLRGATGQPASDYYVIAFSADRANWRQGSRRNLSVRPASDGTFSFGDLPPGEYLVAALTDLEPSEWQEASFLEQVAPAAIKVRIVEGQKTVQDLQIR